MGKRAPPKRVFPELTYLYWRAHAVESLLGPSCISLEKSLTHIGTVGLPILRSRMLVNHENCPIV